MSPRLALAASALVLVGLAGCGQKTEQTTTHASDSTVTTTPPEATTPGGADTTAHAGANTEPVAPKTPPEHIEVQHVLIGFQGSIPGKTITRTKAEAEKLAQDVIPRLADVLAARSALERPGDWSVLRRYARGRAEDVAAMQLVTHGLDRLFAARGETTRELRNLGMRLVEAQPLLKAALGRRAMR
jgi:hypothetical protein